MDVVIKKEVILDCRHTKSDSMLGLQSYWYDSADDRIRAGLKSNG